MQDHKAASFRRVEENGKNESGMHFAEMQFRKTRKLVKKKNFYSPMQSLQNRKGFAIALDALMAIILVTALIVFLSQQPDLPSPGIDTSYRLKEITNNAFATLENSGILGDYLVERVFDVNSARDVNREAEKLVPGNVDLKVKITAFQATTDMAYCRNQQRFEACFDNAIVSVAGKEPPGGKEVVYGKKILAIRQPGGGARGPDGEVLCTMQGELVPKKTETLSYAWFGTGIPSIEFRAEAYSNSMACASLVPPNGSPPDNPPGRVAEYSTIALKARNQTRDPLDVYLILDKSGSMATYDMNLRSKSGNFNEGTCIGVACRASDEGILTNCGVFPGEVAGACGNYKNDPNVFDYYTNYGKNLSWTLSDANFNTMEPDSKLVFVQNFPYGYYGACRACDNFDMSNTRTPFIRVRKKDPVVEATRVWANYAYFTKTQVESGSQFDINGWNSDPNPDNKWAWLAVTIPQNPVAVEDHGSIPKSEDANCNFTPPTLPQCNSDKSVCGQYHRFKTVIAPNSFPVLNGRSDTNILMETKLEMFFSTNGICKPDIQVLFSDSGGSTPLFKPARTTGCSGSPYDYCFFYFPDTGMFRYDDYGARLPMGTYDFYVASDQNLTEASSRVSYAVFLDYIVQPPQTYDSGFCGGASCFYSSTSPKNCPNPPWMNNVDRFFELNSEWKTMTNEQNLDSFTIASGNPFLRGLRVQETFWGYNGACEVAASGFTTPVPPADSNHILMVIPRNENKTVSHGINHPPSVDYQHVNVNDNPLTPPILNGTYTVKGWAPEQTSYQISWVEQRIDAAQYAASGFIDNNNWKFEDTIGTITFSNTAQELTSLRHMDDFNRGKLKGDMNYIITGGETNIADAILKARIQLRDIGKNSRQFIILLSDGLANQPPPPQDALQLAINEASTGYNQQPPLQQIITYTIAFGRDAIDWNAQTGAWQCKEPLTRIAIAGGGKCYPANDPQQLAEIYNLIANQIQQPLGKTDLEMPLYSGQWINNPICNPPSECGSEPDPGCPTGIFLRKYANWPEQFTDDCWPPAENWHQAGNNESIVFKDILINQIGDWWDANFNVAWPCDGDHCFKQLTFPPTNPEPGKGTKITVKQPPTVIFWPTDDGGSSPEQQTVSIRTRDLGVKFLDGNIVLNQTNLRVQLKNLQELPIDLTGHKEPKWQNPYPPPCDPAQIEMRFFQNMGPEPPPFDSAPVYSVCVNPDDDSDNIMIPGEFLDFVEQIPNGQGGYLFVEINPNRGTKPILQCRDNDYDKIFCFPNPAIKYFLLEYWSWLK